MPGNFSLRLRPIQFSPLEKAAGFSRWSADLYADGGLMPPSAKTVGGQSYLTGFTSIALFGTPPNFH
jgi:hypothetical protein